MRSPSMGEINHRFYREKSGHNSRKCWGKLANPYVSPTPPRVAVQSSKVYLPREALLVSSGSAARQINAIR